MGSLIPQPRLQFLDDNGVPRVGAKVFTYNAGLSTKKKTYQDQGLTIENTNPIILDTNGSCTMFGSGSYKVVLAPSTDTDPPTSSIWTVDNINIYDLFDFTGLTASINDLNSTKSITISAITTYTATLADKNKTILANAAAGVFAINLPSVVTVGAGYTIRIKKIDTSLNAVTITPVSGELIDTLTSLTLNSFNDSFHLITDGSTWKIADKVKHGLSRDVTTATILTYTNEKDLIRANATSGAITITLPIAGASGVGTDWEVSVLKNDSTTNTITVVGQSAQTINGATSFILNNPNQSATFRCQSGTWNITSQYYAQGAYAATLPYLFKKGFKLANVSTNGVSVSAGACDSADSSVDIQYYGTAFTKLISSTWTEGSGNGGFPSSLTLTNGTWYDFFVISDNTGIKFDAGYDVVANAANLLATPAAVSAGYTKYRRVGSVFYHSVTYSGIRLFTQVGDRFEWNTPVLSLDISGISTGVNNVTIDVPSRASVLATFNAFFKSNSNFVIVHFHNPSRATGVSESVAPLGNINARPGGGISISEANQITLLSENGTVTYESSATEAATLLKLSVIAWNELFDV